MFLRLGATVLIPLLGFLVLAVPAQAQTVSGPVDEAGDDYLVVDGTRFSVDGETMVRLLPGQDPDDFGMTRVEPPEGAEPGPSAWVPYAPELLVDVSRASVTGTGRLAEQVRLEPHGSGGENNE